MFDENGDRKLCIICSKGTLDMAYPGLVLANAALMEGIDVTLFFTFWGLDMVNDKKMDNLKCTPLGNTSKPSQAMVASQIPVITPAGSLGMPTSQHHASSTTA